MSIKSDHWIRRMAAAHGLIEPFEPGQVRTSERGERVISYGTSSYGYDVRCAREFKVFTNINSTIVDPKRFDEKSFVDIEADVCIIPPNSFALAHTVEYFRIPRNVLTVCLGKCVTGDTRVVDAQTGAYIPITEMRWGRKTLAWDGWRLRPAAASELIPQGKREVFELRTRAGLRIRATANHPFKTAGGWVPLGELRVGDRIAAAREIPIFGKTAIPDWEATLIGLMISEAQCDTSGHGPTHTTTDPTLVRLLETTMRASGFGEVTHKGQYAPLWLQRYGLNVAAAERFVPQTIFTAPKSAVKLFLQALFSGDGGIDTSQGDISLECYCKSHRLIEDVHHLLLRFGIFSLIRHKVTAIGTDAWRVQISGREQVRRFAEAIGFVPGSIKQELLENEVLPMLVEQARIESDILDSAVRVGGLPMSSRALRCSLNQSVPLPAAARVMLATGDVHLGPLAGPMWDTVESIEAKGTEEVFDISVPAYQNFVANGLIVHNSTYARCGIIVNVTPLEPEWEGHVTLEFSNTTPLPARIYANEGVAQMLFFESDEVCGTSYADRGGKYQGQRGVTLPKA